MAISVANQSKPRGEFRGLLLLILFIVLFRTFCFSVTKVPSGSMIPTLLVGDHVVISKFSYGYTRFTFLGGGTINYVNGPIMRLNTPKRGDVSVFTHPGDLQKDLVKRVVGLPGDRVQMIDGVLHVNGQASPMEIFKENYHDHDGSRPISGTIYKTSIDRGDGKSLTYYILQQSPWGSVDVDNTPEYVVPENHLFCVGDNRQGSSDSREDLSFVNMNYLVGPALFVYFSVELDKLSWKNPLTWWHVMTDIRWKRCGYHAINEVMPQIF